MLEFNVIQLWYLQSERNYDQILSEVKLFLNLVKISTIT